MEAPRPQPRKPERAPGGQVSIGFAILCLVAFLSSLDSAVNVAFPPIVADCGIAVPQIKWIVISYILAAASLTIVFGKLGDLFGHKRVLATGVAASALSHLLCAFAPTYEFLIGFRFLQGVSQGLSLSCIVALMTLNVAPERKRGVVGVLVTVVGAGMAAGPILGGMLVDWFGWPSVFWSRAIVAVVILLFLGHVTAPEGPKESIVDFDAAGALLLIVVVGSVISLSAIMTAGQLQPVLLVASVVGILAAGYAFHRHECRHPSPIVEMSHFSHPPFAFLQLAAVTINLSCFSVLLLLPFVLAHGFDLSSFEGGFVLALMPLGMVAAGLAVRRLPGMASPINLGRSGLVLAAGGLIAVGFFEQQSSLAVIAIGLIATGVGLGAFKAGCVDMTTTFLPPAQRGVAGSFYSVTQALGFVLGASLLTGIADWYLAGGHDGQEHAMTFLTVGGGLLAFAIAFFIFTLGSAFAPQAKRN